MGQPRRWRRLLALALVLSALAAPLGARAAEPAEIYTFPPNEIVFPEGIAIHPGNGDMFVGSTANGAVYKGNAWGRDRALRPFLPGGADGRTTAIGMKVSPSGILYIAGGATGTIWMYDAVTGRLLGSFFTGTQGGFINDVALTPDGSAYFTDSNLPYMYRIKPDERGVFQYELWLDFRGTALAYQQGFNLNGIAASADGRYLIVVQSNTGKLFRIDTTSKEVVEIALTGGDRMTFGDGILLDGRTLYVVRNQLNLVVMVSLSEDYASGRQVGSFTDPSFRLTTTAAKVGDRLLVVNSQFNRRGPGLTPETPFSVSSVMIPKR